MREMARRLALEVERSRRADPEEVLGCIAGFVELGSEGVGVDLRGVERHPTPLPRSCVLAPLSDRDLERSIEDRVSELSRREAIGVGALGDLFRAMSTHASRPDNASVDVGVSIWAGAVSSAMSLGLAAIDRLLVELKGGASGVVGELHAELRSIDELLVRAPTAHTFRYSAWSMRFHCLFSPFEDASRDAVAAWFHATLEGKDVCRLELLRALCDQLRATTLERPVSRVVAALLRDTRLMLRLHALTTHSRAVESDTSQSHFGRVPTQPQLLAWAVLIGHPDVASMLRSEQLCCHGNELLDRLLPQLGACSHMRHLMAPLGSEDALVMRIPTLLGVVVHSMARRDPTRRLVEYDNTVRLEHLSVEPLPVARLDPRVALMAAMPGIVEFLETAHGSITRMPGSVVSLSRTVMVGRRVKHAQRPNKRKTTDGPGARQAKDDHYLVLDVCNAMALCSLRAIQAGDSARLSVATEELSAMSAMVDSLHAAVARLVQANV